MRILELLEEIRGVGGEVRTRGLDDAVIARFAERDPKLGQAVDDAHAALADMKRDFPELVDLDELEQAARIQADYVNFYPDDAVNPYVSLAARGPWIVTTKGRVLHDDGGYGMLGLGHAPAAILEAMDRPHVMANVMTANVSQLTMARALRAEVGHRRTGGCPYHRFMCLNSGSEAVTAAARISDINAKQQTDPDGPYAGRGIRIMSLKGGFHGRTDRPARFSDSTAKTYRTHLASFREHRDLVTVEPNDIAGLEQAFADMEAEGVFVEAFFMEPVMGEGNPGQAVTPEFYARARELTEAHGTLLLMDSIQAGLRATGNLSIVDYPGFEELPAPDMETYSKALNAGQYPLSVLAMNERTAALYRKGVYGNTMTSNPRAMDVGAAVLAAVTDDLRRNIVERGEEALRKLEALKEEMGGAITKVQGTGLLFSCELDPRYKAYGTGSAEEYMRLHGIGVIHGGENSLRFTPHFAITSEELDLIVDAVRDALVNGPKRAAA